MADYEYQPTNREKVRNNSKGFGCCVCDRALVGKGKKCKLCGRRMGLKRERLSVLRRESICE